MPKGIPKSGMNKGWFKKNQAPHNAGTAKKHYCKTCKKEYDNSSYKRTYCFHDCKLNGEWGKINKGLNRGRKASKEEKKLKSELAKEGKYHFNLFKPEVRKRTLENAKKALTGKPSWNRGGVAEWAKGENNVNWKGGITSENKKQRVRFRRIMQKDVYKRDNYTCKICDAVGIELHVDHIKSWSEHPNLRFNMDNCRTLCKSCHYYETYGKLLENLDTPWGLNLKSRKVG